MAETKTPSYVQRQSQNACLPFEDIQNPGVYVTQQGDLFRIPSESLAEGRSPIITWKTNRSNMVTFLTSDPWEPISKVRQLAADADLFVNF